MRLEGDAYAFVAGLGGFALPVRQQHLIPLIVQNLRELRRPSTGDPVRGTISRSAARTATERTDDIDSQFRRQAHGDVLGALMPASYRRIGMDGIAMARQSTEGQAMAGEVVFDLLLQGGLREGRLGVEQFALRIGSAGQLDRFQPE